MRSDLPVGFSLSRAGPIREESVEGDSPDCVLFTVLTSSSLFLKYDFV